MPSFKIVEILIMEKKNSGPYFLLNVFSDLKGTHLYILFVVTATGVVLCGSPKKQPRTSTIVQFIFFFWSFEISGNILRIR